MTVSNSALILSIVLVASLAIHALVYGLSVYPVFRRVSSFVVLDIRTGNFGMAYLLLFATPGIGAFWVINITNCIVFVILYNVLYVFTAMFLVNWVNGIFSKRFGIECPKFP